VNWAPVQARVPLFGDIHVDGRRFARIGPVAEGRRRELLTVRDLLGAMQKPAPQNGYFARDFCSASWRTWWCGFPRNLAVPGPGGSQCLKGGVPETGPPGPSRTRSPRSCATPCGRQSSTGPRRAPPASGELGRRCRRGPSGRVMPRGPLGPSTLVEEERVDRATRSSARGDLSERPSEPALLLGDLADGTQLGLKTVADHVFRKVDERQRIVGRRRDHRFGDRHGRRVL